jgi:uncharacterized protein YfiM (DUF2279 family)
MSRLLLIFILLLSFSVSSQNTWKTEWLKQDKALHFTVSTCLVMLGTNTATDFHVKNPEVVGIAFCLGTGLVKELLLDDYPSGYDLTANIAGAIAGVYLNRWINKQIQKMGARRTIIKNTVCKWKYKQTLVLSN